MFFSWLMHVLTLPRICSCSAKSRVLCSFKLPLLSTETRELVLSCKTGGRDFHGGCFVWHKASSSAELWSSDTTPELLDLCREQDDALCWQMLPCEGPWAEPAGADKRAVRRGKDAGVTAGMVPLCAHPRGQDKLALLGPALPARTASPGGARQCCSFSVHQFNVMWICVPKDQTWVN